MEIIMATRKWIDNAFWHDANQKDKAEAILIITDDDGREISQILTVRKYQDDGSINPDFTSLLDEVGESKIDANTQERKERKTKEKEVHEQVKLAEQQARNLEQLFDAKIKILEIDEIKNAKNKELKSKLRRSKNILELNMYAQLIMMQEHNVGIVTRSELEEILNNNAS
jgi:hypothetical protein